MSNTIIVKTPGTLGGKARIDGRRIGVCHVIMWLRQGRTGADLARDYGLSVQQMSAALGYYARHQAEIDAEIAWHAAPPPA